MTLNAAGRTESARAEVGSLVGGVEVEVEVEEVGFDVDVGVGGGVKSSVMVRHVPLQDILSPIFASERMVGQEVIVRDVPAPPVVLESRGRSWDITKDWGG